MKKLLVIFISILLFTACGNDRAVDSGKVVIEGYFTVSQGEKIYLMELSAESLEVIDSATIGEDGKFRFEFEPVESPGLYVLKSNHFNQAITLLVESGESLSIEGDLTNLNENYEVRNSKGSERVHELTQIINGRMATVSKYYNEYRDNPDSLDAATLRANIDSLLRLNQVGVYEDIRAFIKREPASLSSLLALYSRFGRNTILDYKYDADVFKLVSDSLIHKYPNNSHSLKLHQAVLDFENADQLKLERENALSVGKVFPEIILNDIDNQPQQLNMCKAKVCIVTVWVSTNKESWDMNARLKEFYKKYKTKGLDIYSISFDTDKLAWANYCHMDKLVWTNVIGYPREKQMLNAEEKMPRIFVLDADKKIIAKDPSMNKLDSLLISILE
jgi:hypothetical protein